MYALRFLGFTFILIVNSIRNVLLQVYNTVTFMFIVLKVQFFVIRKLVDMTVD